MRLFTNRNMAVHIRVIFILRKEGIPATQYFAKPLKYSRIIENLMLNQFLGDREDDLRTGVPESVEWRFWIPCFDFVRVMQY